MSIFKPQIESDDGKPIFMNSWRHTMHLRILWWTYQISEFETFLFEWKLLHNGVEPEWLELRRR